MVRVVPQLSRDEDLGARDATFPNGCADSGLRAVDASGVDVAVACFQGFGDGVFLGPGVLPGTKANGRCGRGQ